MSIRIILVDDQALVRSGFSMVIDSQDDMTVVGEADDGQQAVSLVSSTPCDLVVMDIRMPVLDGVQATAQIVEKLGDGAPRILILTTFDTDEHLVGALRAGASGFLLKGARPAELLSAIRAIAGGEAVLAPSATKRLLEQFTPELPAPRSDVRLESLTDREREVLMEVTTGATNPEIAAKLHMAEGTVKTHIGRLLHKTQSRDRVGLVLFAHDMGLL
ncbi:response regulator [Epidermidibacterium keratini]|uniref:Response regulator n=1 Tax=Epidermidibacterium keratini TaxID=1891644 RepID=A0A7L4YM28_9ACTN|nr:response regulator transcription factor [Epidermidibacterium keratini]QHC00226.1 response regulator [Epidermidibacterium keratini]